ncbi:MAG TPA: histidinol-phosphate aminotransferase family protein, partial [Myxococcales bacterium]|nr:histidinol-phosphate aminotransferase family protein [Myxococcales bacterium]
VIVDEAYYEFCGESAIALVDTYSNIVVTRTFSKSFGIAGLRVGYMVGPAAVLHDVRRVFNPKSVNVLGQIAAVAALDDLEYLYSYVREVQQAREQLAQWFQERGMTARTTAANYILVQVPHPSTFISLCEEESVYIRDRSSEPQLDGYVRIGVGTVEQCLELCTRFERVLSRMPQLT